MNDLEMQRRETTYVDVGQTSRYSGPHLSDPVTSTSAYVGGVLRGVLSMEDHDDDGVGQHQRQHPAVVDVDFCQYYDHTATVCRQRHESSGGTTTWNTERASAYYCDDSEVFPSLWPDSRSTTKSCFTFDYRL